ncbi:SDR family oxidoreductase [Microlunatus sp. GCM10028923]|uniref:SDR family oxidoreductase n=1 Tax=Microlunatus sp. GCM10028923 TaxID=3273400 RepID=UPI0036075B0C
MIDLAGRRIAVTGATGGIGSSLSEALSATGARLAITGRSPGALGQLTRLPGVEVARTASITDEPAVASFLASAADAFGGLDALITLAGRSIPGQVAETTIDQFTEIMDSNLLGTFLACKHAVDKIVPGGLIISVGSMAALRPNATAPLYCTAKAAVAMFGQALNLQLADRRIRVTTINPGGVDTGFWGDRPVDRSTLLSPGDVAESIMFTLRLPSHVAVRELTLESTGRRG